MIEISNSTAQTLTPGQAIAFDVTNLKTRCTAECHKTGMTDVRLRLNGIYEIVFSGNIGGVAAGAVQEHFRRECSAPGLYHDLNHRCGR